MKTEERVKSNLEPQDDEQLNDLNDVLQQIMPYWRTIAGVVVLVVGALVLFNLLSSGRKAARESGWSEYLAATANRDATQLQALADNSSDELAGWAQHSAAQAKLVDASAAVHVNRAQAKMSYEEAVTGFTRAIPLASGQDLIQKQSIWGLGQAHEGLQELGKAKEQYQQIVDKWPDSSIAEQAKKRLASLDDPATKKFYDWFYAQTPPAQQLPPTGEVPGLPFDVPSTPDISIPDPSELTSPAGDADTDEIASDPIDEIPAAEENPAEQLKVDEPVAEDPAEEESAPSVE